MLKLSVPKGFSLYGVRCGISSVPGKKDLALFYSDRPVTAAGIFTSNLAKAAPVLLSREHLRGGRARAILINSGCANACTGTRGLEDSRWSVRAVAAGLGVPVREVLVASTGVIGRFLPRPALGNGIRDVIKLVRSGARSAPLDAVHAIMTTDTREKIASATFRWQGRRFSIWGCAKGAGMIHPNMATMLSVILTDVVLPRRELQDALRWAADQSFNCVSVDGDTSTNDSLFLLANGAGSSTALPFKAGLQKAFRAALLEVCSSLAAKIAADGEGATRTLSIVVRGARNDADAKRLAATVATSPLVKTALHGADPNWGRVMAALGRAGVAFDPNRVEILFGKQVVCRKGQRAVFSEKRLHKILKRDAVSLEVDLHQGRGSSRYLTCDFSKEYVSVNADYTT